MKPNFALSLSVDGIMLLHRVGTGWSLVGDVPLDAPDLASQLAVLRKTGLALDSQGMRTKVLIPNDQIRYLALDTTRAAEDDVRRALVGATPYAIDDLAYDYVRGGGRTYIAAVARETLAEAEAFAAEHRFGPVCIAAVPAPFTYVGEAYFGPTSMAPRLLAPGQVVQRDEVAVSLPVRPRLGESRLAAAIAPVPPGEAPAIAPVPPGEAPALVVPEPLAALPGDPALAGIGTPPATGAPGSTPLRHPDPDDPAVAPLSADAVDLVGPFVTILPSPGNPNPRPAGPADDDILSAAFDPDAAGAGTSQPKATPPLLLVATDDPIPGTPANRALADVVLVADAPLPKNGGVGHLTGPGPGPGPGTAPPSAKAGPGAAGPLPNGPDEPLTGVTDPAPGRSDATPALPVPLSEASPGPNATGISQAGPASPDPQAHPASPVPQAHPASPDPQAHPASPVPQAHPASPVPQAGPASPVPQAGPASPVPQAGPVSPEPAALALREAQVAAVLALPNLPGQSLTEDPVLWPPVLPGAVVADRVDRSGPVAVNAGPQAAPQIAEPAAGRVGSDLTHAAGPVAPGQPADPATRPSLVPEPVFASRARPLREGPLRDGPLRDGQLRDGPPQVGPASLPGVLRTAPGAGAAAVPRPDDRSEPMFVRRPEPPVQSPVQSPIPSPLAVTPATVPVDLLLQLSPVALNGAAAPGRSVAAAGPPDLPVALIPALGASPASRMSPPRLTGAGRTPADPLPTRPFDPRPPEAAAARIPPPGISGQSAAARPAAAAAATIIPFRPSADPAAGPAATPVSIQTVLLTRPGPVPLPVAASFGVAPPEITLPDTAPALQPGKAGYFASRHGKVATGAAAGLPATARPEPVVYRTQPAVGGKPRYLGLLLTLLLLACLAAVAAWASLVSETGLAGLFGRDAGPNVATPADPAPGLDAPEITGTALADPLTPGVDLAAASPTEAAAGLVETALPGADPLPQAAVAAVISAAEPAPPAQPDAASVPALVPAPDSAVTPALDAASEPAMDPTGVDPTGVDPTEVALAAEIGTVISPAEADRIYAATGVWLRAPRLSLLPAADPVGSPGFAAPDQGALRLSRPVLPSVAGAAPDPVLTPQPDPPAAGTVYARDARGFVLATAEGTLTPTGIMVFAGLPAVVPPNRPGSAVALPPVTLPVTPPVTPPETPPVTAVAAPPLAPRETPAPPAGAGAGADPAAAIPVGPDTPLAPVTAGGVGLVALAPLVRPLLRPDTALPGSDLPPVAVLPVLAVYAGPRPALRPAGLTPQTTEAAAALPATDPAADPVADPIADPSLAVADTVAAILAAAPADPLATATALAVSSARVPEPRPQNFAAVVAAAEARNAAPLEDVANASLAVITAPPQVAPDVVDPAPVAAAAVAPAQVAPDVVAASGPVSGGVAAAATQEAAIDLRSVNLIGVFGRPNDRRALVRLSNGRYVRVAVGDSLDGGQVAAIGDNALNYVKRGQTITIAIPNG